ncbi:MAG: hypothetical protein WAV31_04660 [Candidatus Moraniibacteriota bacterium]
MMSIEIHGFTWLEARKVREGVIEIIGKRDIFKRDVSVSIMPKTIWCSRPILRLRAPFFRIFVPPEIIDEGNEVSLLLKTVFARDIQLMILSQII